MKSKPSNVVKRYFSEIKTSSEKNAKPGLLLLCSPWKLCTGVSLALGARYLLSNGPAYCKALRPPSRIIQRRPNVDEDTAKFDWETFLSYLRPHYLLLTAAVAVRSYRFLLSWYPILI